MSNYPPTPSFGGPFGYMQQWPPHPPPTSSSTVRPIPPDFAINNARGRQEYISQGSFNTDSHLPGLGMPGGSLPPFFVNPQFSAPFYPAPLNALGYQPMSSHTAHVSSHPGMISTQSGPLSVPSEPSHAFRNLPNTQAGPSSASSDELDREEGEVSEKNDESSSGRDGNFSRSPIPHVTEYESTYRAGHNSKDLNGPETGRDPSKPGTSGSLPHETSRSESTGIADIRSSSESSKSRRDASESPYNPPISINVEPLEDLIRGTSDKASQRVTDSRTEPNPIDNKDGRLPYLAGKTPAQMRVLAQGALLGLAPHNIRYNELVNEDINPAILRQLYEDIGIKIVPTVSGSKAVAEVITDSTAAPARAAKGDPGPVEIQNGSVSTVQISQTQATRLTTAGGEAPEAPGKEAAPAVRRTSAVQTETSKPLERKEVIARMLAAKANKVSKPPSTVTTEIPSVPANKLGDAPAKTAPSAETQVKEKNKAQTELARQRMEQLKKQGLQKSQERLQAAVSSQASSQQNSNQASVTLTLQHPLPERPPDPERAAAARIPGLFMMESEPSDAAEDHARGPVADSLSTETKTMPRKRPRASDFDEPIPTSKKTFVSEDRLVIDISEDESLYGEDEEGPKTVAETATGNVARVTNQQRKVSGPSHQPTSGATTPQNTARLTDQEKESLRQRNLEIQAMRRRIAEYEQRQKAKLAAGRTQSPGSSNAPSSTSLSGVSSEAPMKEAPAALVTGSETKLTNQHVSEVVSALPTDSGLRSLHRSPSVQSLVSMDSARLEAIRQKILRRQEIQSGLPALDAELSKSEAKLAEYKREEERLLAEIAKGQQGRKQLIDELEALGIETEGLTLEELQAAKNEAEQQERPEAAQVSAPVQPQGHPETPGPDNSLSSSPSGEESPDDRVAIGQLPQEPREASAALSSRDDEMMVDVERENSRSASLGSSMDESTSSPQSTSIDQSLQSNSGALDRTTVPVSPAVCETEMSTDFIPPIEETRLTSQPPGESGPAIETASDNAKSSLSENIHPSRGSSVASDIYEPPEPEDSPDDAGSPYNHSLPRDVEAETVPVTPSSLRQADEALTKHIQEPTRAREPRFGILGDEPRKADLAARFSPYISPLRFFRSYRYHPKFTEDVPGGYRSLSYSHNVDLVKPVCPYEAAGGVCNDSTCEFQHWRDMVLSDDKILVQMGSLREGKTPEEREKYIEGLKQIINDMRRDKVKDFHTVATEIAAYRRRFLQDPSRVVPL